MGTLLPRNIGTRNCSKNSSMPRGVWVAQGWQSTHVKYRTEGGVVRQLFLQLQIDLVAQLTNI